MLQALDTELARALPFTNFSRACSRHCAQCNAEILLETSAENGDPDLFAYFSPVNLTKQIFNAFNSNPVHLEDYVAHHQACTLRRAAIV
jgi:hypothetical protein